jgi:hypothetical protein
MFFAIHPHFVHTKLFCRSGRDLIFFICSYQMCFDAGSVLTAFLCPTMDSHSPTISSQLLADATKQKKI